jgi:hypothetical protein
MGRVAVYLNEAVGDFSLRVQNHCLSVRMIVSSQMKLGISDTEAKRLSLELCENLWKIQKDLRIKH